MAANVVVTEQESPWARGVELHSTCPLPGTPEVTIQLPSTNTGRPEASSSRLWTVQRIEISSPSKSYEESTFW